MRDNMYIHTILSPKKCVALCTVIASTSINVWGEYNLQMSLEYVDTLLFSLSLCCFSLSFLFFHFVLSPILTGEQKKGNSAFK